MRPPPLLRTLALLAAAAAAPGDDVWLVPARSAVPPGVEVAVDVAGGAAFPASALPLQPDDVTEARLRLGGRDEALPAPTARRGGALRYRVPLRRPGVATVWVTLAPQHLGRDSTEVAALLASIGAPDSVRRAYLAQRAPRRWRELETVRAAAYLLVSSPLRRAPASDTSWGVPTGGGAPLELVAARDPTRLRAGDSVVVRVLRAGRPVYAFPVALLGGPAPVLRRSGPAGIVAFRLPRAGRWLLRAAELRRPPAGAEDVDWACDRVTLAVVAR